MTQNGRKTLQGTGTEPAGLYPHGLVQPSGAWRFGLDALLLGGLYGTAAAGLAGAAGYLCRGAGLRLRAALLGAALACPRVRGLGLEREVALTAAATENIVRLGLSARLAVRCLDVGDAVALRGLPGPDSLQNSANWSGPGGGALCGRADAVLANPPYDRAGRPSPDPLRERALRSADGQALEAFCRAAGLLLRHKGAFFLLL